VKNFQKVISIDISIIDHNKWKRMINFVFPIFEADFKLLHGVSVCFQHCISIEQESARTH